jgi:hypothetical protein
MIKPDLIISHPKDVYYTLWVQQLLRDRHLFNKVIVIITQFSTDRDYVGEVQLRLGNAIIRPYRTTKHDWRNSSVNTALSFIDSDWVLFSEQDFFTKEGFYEDLFGKVNDFGFVGTRDMQEQNRFHPACLLVKKDLIKQTTKDFSIIPDKGDHFSLFTKELEALTTFGELEKLTSYTDWFHMAGLTQNYRLQSDFFQPQRFYTYLVCSLKLDQPKHWREITRDKIHDMELSGDRYELSPTIKSFFDEYE